MTHTEKITKARAQMVLDEPFFATIVMRMKFVEDYSCEVAWINGKQIGYNPNAIEALSLSEVKGLLAHEVMHVACMHHLRRNYRDPKLWNVACDYAINLLLKDSGMSLPTGGLLDYKYKNMSSEQIYKLLDDQRQANKKKNAKQKEDPDSGGAQGDGNSEQDDESNSDNINPEMGDDEEGKTDDDSTGSDGDGNDDNEEANDNSVPDESCEPSDDDSGEGDNSDDDSDDAGEDEEAPEKEIPSYGEVRDGVDDDGEPLKNGDLTKAEQDMKVLICQAALEAKMQGVLPGALGLFVDEIIKPKVNWVEELKRFVDQVSKNNYQWTPPNRRYVHRGLYLPSLKGEEIKSIVIAVDTSISIDDDVVKQFIGELAFVVEAVNAQEVTVIYCDTDVRRVDTFQHGDVVTCVEAPGRGGTNFIPPFKYVEDNNIDPACLIYLTDMYCYSFPTEPNYPVLWACYGGYVNKHISFGEIIYID